MRVDETAGVCVEYVEDQKGLKPVVNFEHFSGRGPEKQYESQRLYFYLC